MFLIEISDDSGISYYEVLGLDPDDLADLNAKKASKLVRNTGKKKKREYNRAAQKGDQAAEEKLALINAATSTLKDEENRKAYDEQLLQGKGALLEVLRIRRVAAPFFRDRLARFRVIEQMFRENGWTPPYTAGI